MHLCLVDVLGRLLRVLNSVDDVELDAVDHFALLLYEHGHIDHHVVQFADARLQLENVAVSRLDVGQRLARLRRVGDNLPLTKLGSQ